MRTIPKYRNQDSHILILKIRKLKSVGGRIDSLHREDQQSAWISPGSMQISPGSTQILGGINSWHREYQQSMQISPGSGWPRHRENRENREFDSYFFQTGKTQGILLWHRENFWDTGKIFWLYFVMWMLYFYVLLAVLVSNYGGL